jgi:ammonium transporter, Amt family
MTKLAAIIKIVLPISLLLAPGLASAQSSDLSAANTAWILTSTALVLFMTLPGLSLFYGGLVRSKNVLSVLMQCFSIAVVISVLWLLVGYSIAFGPSDSAYWGGLSKALFSGVVVDSPALIVGAFVERIKFSAMLLFTSLWTLLVYFPVANWVWGGGWLGQMGLIDFAGGTVVHVTAGVGALVTALVLGQRKEFLSASTMPHNLTMSFTGAGMLWVGWFGFNAGSALAADGAAGMAMFVTHISSSANPADSAPSPGW